MNKRFKILILSVAGVLSLSSVAQTAEGVKIVANDAQGQAVGSASVTVDSKLLFTQDGVKVVGEDSQTAFFSYSDISTLSFKTPGGSGVSDVTAPDDIRLLKNPVAEVMYISAPEGFSSPLAIYDESGVKRLTFASWSGQAIDVSDLDPGFYFVTLNSTNLKFIKK